MEPINTPEVLTPPQLADWLQVGKKWVTRYTQERRIPGQFKAGKYWRYDRVELEKYRLSHKDTLLPKAKR